MAFLSPGIWSSIFFVDILLRLAGVERWQTHSSESRLRENERNVKWKGDATTDKEEIWMNNKIIEIINVSWVFVCISDQFRSTICSSTDIKKIWHSLDMYICLHIVILLHTLTMELKRIYSTIYIWQIANFHFVCLLQSLQHTSIERSIRIMWFNIRNRFQYVNT